MDELDHNLLMAWDRVFERCRKDPVEARRRYDRMRAGGVYDRPVRAWCVAIRASDSRLDELVYGGESAAMRARVAHEIEVDAYTLSALCGPVRIPYPGVPMREAAAMLGRDPASIKKWLPVQIGKTVAEKEAFVQERYRSGSGRGERRWAEYYAHETGRGVFNVRYEPAGAAGRKAGMEVPVVWCDHDLDPGGFMGRPPSRWWGTLWRYLADAVPDHFEQGLVREPVVQPYEGGARFRGWQWRCPGLLEARGVRLGARGKAEPLIERGEFEEETQAPGLKPQDSTCGRAVRALYAPLPVRTIGEYFGVKEGLEVEGLSGQWYPGVMDRWAGRRSLACERCWKIKRQTFTNSTGWNELVTYLSGGLLYGREVEKPSDFEFERRRKRVPRAKQGGRLERGRPAAAAAG